jgi:hypothetical protein
MTESQARSSSAQQQITLEKAAQQSAKRHKAARVREAGKLGRILHT